MISNTISHYKILEKLGSGGMGVVYKAQDTKLDRYVALKFLPLALSQDEENKKRFINEAKAASALNHPNIATIYEIDEVDGQMFIAMEYIEGKALNEIIHTNLSKGSTLRKVLDYAIQITEGLSKAHAKGIIHRDIKPANILVTEEGLVKIVDFGLAKLAGRTMLTKEGTTLGTVAYMSPEQTQGTDIDHQTDIWSLGAVIYEMLTGEPPFKGDYEQAVIYSILNEEPKPLYDFRDDVPHKLAQLVDKALQKASKERHENMAELQEALRSVAQPMRSAGQKEGVPAIAVLPFANMSADPQQEYFCDGMAEEIINALVNVEGLRVAARTSAFAFKGKQEDIREIGRKLSVDKVLEGSVRKAGNRLRVTAQLIDVADGYHLWSERYDRELQDIFAIQ
ncbi:MAG: protein kinase, partial [Candidatus Zixiibacteriota bacterium]